MKLRIDGNIMSLQAIYAFGDIFGDIQWENTLGKADIFVHRRGMSTEKHAVEKGENAENKALYSENTAGKIRRKYSGKQSAGEK